MLHDVFENEKEKATARKALNGFADNPAWKLMQKALDANVAHFSNLLRERRDFANLEEVYALQDRISDIESFKELPEKLLEAAAIEPDEGEDDSPY